MFVQLRSDADPSIDGPSGNLATLGARLRWRADQIPAQLLGAKRGIFAVNWLGSSLRKRLKACRPDIVHLHWVNAGFVSLGEIAALIPGVVMTAHDMWPFTGGCHYDAGCGNYATTGCTRCPMQSRSGWIPLARQRLQAKASASGAAKIEFVSPSRWLGDVARASPVTKDRPIHVIPNCIDSDRFKPIDRRAARDLFNLPQGKTILLFGALNADADPRKGFALLDAALRSLSSRWSGDDVVLCIFGSSTRGESMLHGFPVRNVGRLHDEEALAALYCAADLFVSPSLQDNLPNTVMEAAACGTPTVAFQIGGMSDLVEDGVTGWLAKPGDSLSLASKLSVAVESVEQRAAAGAAARARAMRLYSYPVIAQRHLTLYRNVLASRHAAT